MKITCQSCQAKYTIADEKVAGKVVKIRCKKCGATIVVNGGDSAGAATDSVRTAEGVAAEGWTVNVGDGDQRTMTDDEIVAAYRSQVIDDETYCWKEGMGDWAPLREIPTLYDACTAAQAGARQAPASSRLAHHAKGSGSGPAPVAARRTGGRAGAADLFGTAAQAGSDDDVMTSAPAKMTRSRDDARSVSGGRADSDVLFSLSASAMTSKSERHPPASANTEGSGLIDIRQLAEQLRAQDSTNKRKSSNRVDDIMNLSGGGAFLPNLSVPSLPPPIDVASIGATAKPSIAPSKGRGVVFLAAGGGLLVILAAIGGTVAVMRGSGDETATAKDRPSASAAASAAAASLAAAPSESAAPAASESAAAAPDQSANEAPVASASASAAGESPAPPPAARAPAPAAPPQPKVAAPAAPRESPAPKAAAPEADQPFNMGEAKARLAAAASAAQQCKKPSGPTGTGRVVVVFAPSGAAQSASVTGDPFEGTPTGGCVAAHFKSVHVPAFSGSPFSVSKSFTVN